jgi:putative nucleotidyltransferase with HDIG domain
MPASVAQLASIMGQGDSADISEVSRIIELDEAMSANLLRMANSAMSGGRTTIQCIRDAVVRLGLAQILKLAVGRQIAGPMQDKCEGYEMAEHELWRHSVAAALAAEHMGDFAKESIPKFSFTAALMHDIGKLLLGRNLGVELVAEIQSVIKEKKVTYIEAEQMTLGTNHAEVGGAIARYWKFPEELISAIELHHDPDPQPDPLMDAVHLANIVAKLIGVGLGAEAFHLAASSKAPGRLGISSAGLEALCVVVRDRLADEEKLYLGEKDEV